MQLQDLGDRATEGPQQKADHNKKLPSHGLAHLVVLFLASVQEQPFWRIILERTLVNKVIEGIFDHCHRRGRVCLVILESVFDHCKVDGREISVGTEGVVDFDEVMQ